MLDQAQVERVAESYLSEIERALKGEVSNLRMYPTYLQPVDVPSLKEGREALVLEIGGTNLYGARVGITNYELQITNYAEKPLSKREFLSVEDFFNEVGNSLQSVIQAGGFDALGLVYSFPGRVIKEDYGVDMISEMKLPKGFIIPGIGKLPIGGQLRGYLKLPQTPLVVLNDTPAVLLSTKADIGGVVGTGFNLAMVVNNQIYNSESGGFEILGMGTAHQLVPGAYLQGKGEAEEKLSAQLVGVMIGSFIRGYLPQKTDIQIPMEGSIFWKIPGYVELVSQTVTQVCGKAVKFLQIEHASIYGGAISALSLV